MEIHKNITKKRSVCIIGAGSAGLVMLKNILVHREEFGEIISYEQTKSVGGTWNYVENTGTDENGLPIHSSMYKNMWTNSSKYVMAYPDYQITSDNCFLHHAEVLKYYQEFSKHFQLHEHIQFECVVRNVSRNENVWKIKIEDLKNKTFFEKQFDIVVMCLGRFGTPRISDCDGIEKFKGQVLHSHYYRAPESFKDKKVLIIGSGFSGIDISIELAQFSDKIYLLDRKKKPSYKELGKVNLINGEVIEFTETGAIIRMIQTNETIIFENVDTMLLCTGYRINFDILDPSCGLATNSDDTVDGLYRHIINMYHPSMAVIGINSLSPQAKLFYVQSLFIINLLLGKFELPSVEEMIRRNDEEMECKLREGFRRKDRHKFSVTNILKYIEQLEDEAGLGRTIKPVYLRIYADTRKNIIEMPLQFKKVIYKVINDEEFTKEC